MSQQQDNPQTTKADDLTGLRCPKCDYDLTGLAKTKCPECGTIFDPSHLRVSNDWDSGNYRRMAIWILIIVTLHLSIQIFAVVAARLDIPLFEWLVVVLHSAGFVPIYANGAAILLAFILTLRADSKQAYTSALIAFAACIVGIAGVLFQFALLANHH